MKNPVIAIVGIGESGSIGYTLANRIIENEWVMERIGSTINGYDKDVGLFLKNRDADNTCSDKGKIMHYIAQTLTPAADDKHTLHYLHKVQPCFWEKIVKDADLIFFCYNSYNNVLYWEPNNRNKFFPVNKNETDSIIDIFGSICGGTDKIRDNFKGQVVFVTNPSHQLATYFQEKTNLEQGQVLAFAPEQYRFSILLRTLADKNAHLRPYVDGDGTTPIRVLGVHGENVVMVLPDGFDVPGFYSKGEGINGSVAQRTLDRLILEGQDVRLHQGSTADNVVPHMMNFVRASIIGDDAVFCWGVYQDGVFCSLPFVNKIIEKDGRRVWRAEVDKQYLDNLVAGKGVFVYPSKREGCES